MQYVENENCATIGHEVVVDLLNGAAIALNSTSSALIAWEKDRARIVSSYGLPSRNGVSLPVSRQARDAFTQSFFAQTGVMKDAQSPFSQNGHIVANIVLRWSKPGECYTLTTFNNRQVPGIHAHSMELMFRLAGALSHHLQLVDHIENSAASSTGALQWREAPIPYQPTLSASAATGEFGAVTAFLLKTLLKKSRALKRSGTTYFGVRTWKTAIKAHQVEALRSAKLSLPAPLIDAIATELADEAHALVGKGFLRAVAGVPCGHSGEGCLSARLAQAVADRLGLPVSKAFEAWDTDLFSGSSHPRKNMRRPPMRLHSPSPGATLLVDDVATSGAHITEATRLLREAEIPVVPLAWIAA